MARRSLLETFTKNMASAGMNMKKLKISIEWTTRRFLKSVHSRRGHLF